MSEFVFDSQDADEFYAAIQRVRKLHRKINGPADDFTCQTCAVNADWYPEYPCPTIKALDGEK